MDIEGRSYILITSELARKCCPLQSLRNRDKLCMYEVYITIRNFYQMI